MRIEDMSTEELATRCVEHKNPFLGELAKRVLRPSKNEWKVLQAIGGWGIFEDRTCKQITTGLTEEQAQNITTAHNSAVIYD